MTPIETCTHRVRHEHGTLTGYVSCRCRCDACTHAMATYHARRNHEGNPRRLDPTGTMRRLQALAVEGWSLADVAAEMGYDAGLTDVLHGRRAYVLRDTARAVAQAFDALARRAPAMETRWQRIAVSRTRRAARARGWAPWAAWDHIDDPADRPRGIRTTDRPHGATPKDVAELAADGLTRDQIAARLGIRPGSVTTALRRARRAA